MKKKDYHPADFNKIYHKIVNNDVVIPIIFVGQQIRYALQNKSFKGKEYKVKIKPVVVNKNVAGNVHFKRIRLRICLVKIFRKGYHNIVNNFYGGFC